MSETEAPAADWYSDPSGRFEYRYWDGAEWTGHVSTDGKTDWDPPGETAPEAGGDAAGDAAATVEPAEAAEAAPAVAEVAAEAPATPEPAAEPAPAEVDDGLPADHNLAANLRAGVDDDVRAWLDEIAGQVSQRLSRINADWASQPQAAAAQACAYGLLVGHMATIHPHMSPELSSVAEVHESFSTLEAGKRLDTLSTIAGDPESAAAWLGPLIGVTEADKVAQLFD